MIHAIAKHGLDATEWAIDDEALLLLIRRYTREAGRAQSRARALHPDPQAVKELTLSKTKSITVEAKTVADYLGVPVPLRRGRGRGSGRRGHRIGVDRRGRRTAHHRSRHDAGKGKMTVTGNLRDVMKESISAAASACAIAFGIEPPSFDKKDIHVHVPEGATPKDGPSAGVAMVSAIVSVMTGIPVAATSP